MAAAPVPTHGSKLQSTNILIIGGTSGVGWGLASALLADQKPSTIIISSSSQTRITDAITRLKSLHPSSQTSIHGFACDLSSADTIESNISALFTSIASTLGPATKLDHVIFTAGDALANVTGPVASYSLTKMQAAGMVRFFAPLLVAKHLSQHMNSSVSSSFTLSTSGVTDRPRPNFSVLNGYLVGISGVARSLAREFAPIRVNAVGLGAVDTEIWDGMRAAGKWEGFEKAVAEKNVTGRMGKVEDVVESYLYLMKDWNVTGETLKTTGGDFGE